MYLKMPELEGSTQKIFSRSSGAGGQNVNKTSTKVTLRFRIRGSKLSQMEQERLMQAFPSGSILVTAQETRSQSHNLRSAFVKLEQVIRKNLRVQKPRKKSLSPHRTAAGKKKKAAAAHHEKYRRRWFEY